ncbi:AfsR/SARP family transcriptional regulator [Actinocrinis puniceicyclus]|uniref:AfsR/SARP family transcriptional regulator n=1 Tax=Actinocrinis puniceicyclus TaxID=977794 RepID=A0A8J7WHL6_9ACTN|nr:AfsR/SARP family transcriptional regulator [Actinocrinis puniceicyclus]MBS2962368.1 AfsR/SARP family transcriptional regulator [Actinocrinis puniceicyclus]
MRYEVLGSLRITAGERTATVRAAKPETVLATLLARSDEVVTTDQLCTELWGESPPRRFNAALHVYISRLRKLLGDLRGGGENPIVTHTSGYVLKLGPDRLDALDFRRLLEQGRERARRGELEAAVDTLERATALWRGPALENLQNGPIVSVFAGQLDEQRLGCAQLSADCRLRLGWYREAAEQLQELVKQYPYHEVFCWQLMLALGCSGRRADAIKAYHAIRDVLDRDLGLEPCRAVNALHQAILIDEPVPDVSELVYDGS